MKVVYQWWSWVVVAAVMIQVGFAGFGAFYSVDKADNGHVATEHTFDTGFGAHFFGALGVILSVLVLLIIGIAAGIGRWRLGRHGVLALLVVLQIVLAGIAFGVSAVGFLHAVNALVIFGYAVMIAYSTRREARAPAATPASAPGGPTAAA